MPACIPNTSRRSTGWRSAQGRQLRHGGLLPRADLRADTLSDPLWEDFRLISLTFGFRACWSMPMRSHRGEVLGTFALYNPTPGLPDRKQIELMTFASNLAGIALDAQACR